jgi:hypothetical protein
MSELKGFIDAVGSLKDAVNDPGNIVGDALRDLEEFKKAFETGVGNDVETMWNDSKDERDNRIKLPDSLAPTTEDHNIIYVDPESDGQFSTPNPLSPNQRPRDLKASTGSSDDVAVSGASPDMYPRLVSRVVSSAPGSVNTSNTKQPLPAEHTDRPLGIFSNKPMPQWTMRPPLGGLPDNFGESGHGNWLTRLAGIASQNPTQLAPPPQTGGRKPVRYLGRRIVDQSQASAFATGAPAAPLAPSIDPNFSGGLAGRIAALAGIDPQNSTQPAFALQDDALRGFYRDEPLQPWFVQSRR